MKSIELTRWKKGILNLALNRPDIHNAFDDVFLNEFITALTAISLDPEVRVVILTGNGNNFSAGADLQWMQRMVQYSLEENYRDALLLSDAMHTLYTLNKPTIGMIHGHAMGGGVGLVACCDIAIASSDAQFCFSEVKLGLIPAVISPYVINAMGSRMAHRYFLTAERFSAHTAQRIGLIHEVVEKETLRSCALELAQHMLHNSPAAISAAKNLIHAVENTPINELMLKDTSQRIAAIRITPEAQEGMQAFLQKRFPDWYDEVNEFNV